MLFCKYSLEGCAADVTAWTSCGSGMWCVCVNICMNDGALKAGKKLYISVCGLCVARDS
jgi:hypothetical protein